MAKSKKELFQEYLNPTMPAEASQDHYFAGHSGKEKIGILLVHGFTGNPMPLLPWAKYLNNLGYTVSLPTLPGHGTKPEDLNKVKWESWFEKANHELAKLLDSCDKVFIFGLSMGGGLTLRLTQAAFDRGDEIAGIVLVNPMIHIPGLAIKFGSIISRFQKFRATVGDDIRKQGVTEYSYDLLPLVGVVELNKMLKLTRSELAKVNVPVLLFHSVEDHVLPISNSDIIHHEISSKQVERLELTASYHVATLDYDADVIFEKSANFLRTY